MSGEQSTQKLVIWGASGHALVVADIFRLSGNYEIVGFLDDLNPDKKGTNFCGSQILGGNEQLDSLYHHGVKNIFLGFGNCAARLKLGELVIERGFDLPVAIHPSAVVARGVSIGAGTVVVAGAVINPEVKVGANAIINTGSSVDHECIIEDGAHISPGAHLAGQVTVGRGAWIGIGATVIEKVRIGAGSIIGAGAVVVEDIPAGVLAYGIPAKPIRSLLLM